MNMIEPQINSPGPERPVPQHRVWKSALLTLPMIGMSFIMLFQGSFPSEPGQLAGTTIVFILCNVLFFLMIHTGKVNKYRKPLFILTAFCFSLTFICNLIEVRGSMMLTQANMLDGETPFCHLVIPMVIIPAALTKTIIFPGSMLNGWAAIGLMLVMWAGISLVLGRGWCSWACFFGGFDEGFSCLRKKTVIKKIDRRWTYFPWAVLIGVALMSAVTLSPFYCEWLCPFKAVTEFEQITSFKLLVQTIIFGSLFLALVVILPILTRRRIQCGLFCPFAAFQSLTNKINIFEVRIDQEACKDCGKCIRECPTFSLDEKSVEAGKTLMSCTKCGKCVDNCPRKAAAYHIKGTPFKLGSEATRLLYVYPAFLILVIIGGDMICDALIRLIKLATTGSLL
ncbi:MAG: 4Fe-4S binding protein [Chitinophagales bacterium]